MGLIQIIINLSFCSAQMTDPGQKLKGNLFTGVQVNCAGPVKPNIYLTPTNEQYKRDCCVYLFLYNKSAPDVT